MTGRLSIDVQTTGVPEAEAMLRGVGLRAVNPRSVYERVTEDFGRQMGRVFASDGTSAHQRWAPLADATLERKAAQGQSKEILQATGRLRASLVGPNSERLGEVDAHGVTLGTRVPYAVAAQARKGAPTRPISVPESAQAEWVEWLTQEIVEGGP